MGVSEDRAIWLARHVLPHEPAVRGWLRKARHAEPDIDDIVQETYARLVSAQGVGHVRNARAYVFRTAHSVVADRFRRKSVVSISDLAEIETLGGAAEILTPEDHVEARNELQLLMGLIAQMPDKTRRIFMLSRVSGLSQKAVSARTGVPESTVEKHIAKGFRLLLAAYANGGYHAPVTSRMMRSDSEPREAHAQGDQRGH